MEAPPKRRDLGYPWDPKGKAEVVSFLDTTRESSKCWQDLGAGGQDLSFECFVSKCCQWEAGRFGFALVLFYGFSCAEGMRKAEKIPPPFRCL